MKARRRNRGRLTAPAILNLGARWMSVGNITYRQVFLQKRTEQEAGGTAEPVWRI